MFELMIEMKTNIKINTNGDNIEKKLKKDGTVGDNVVCLMALLLFIIN